MGSVSQGACSKPGCGRHDVVSIVLGCAVPRDMCRLQSAQVWACSSKRSEAEGAR